MADQPRISEGIGETSDGLLQKAYQLRNKITQEIDLLNNSKVSLLWWPRVRNIRSFRKSYSNLFHEFSDFDREVSHFLILLSSDNSGDDTKPFYASAISNQRETLFILLRNLRDAVFEYSNAVTSRWAFIVACLSVVLVVYQIYLMRGQDEVTQEQIRIFTKQNKTLEELKEVSANQLQISKRQDETARLLFLRKPDLKLSFKVVRLESQNIEVGDVIPYRLVFFVTNSGDKAIKEFYINILFPTMPTQSVAAMDGRFQNMGETKIDGIKYTNYKAYFATSVFPTADSDAATLHIKGQRQHFKVFWNIISEDGKFPSKEGYGDFLIEVK